MMCIIVHHLLPSGRRISLFFPSLSPVQCCTVGGGQDNGHDLEQSQGYTTTKVRVQYRFDVTRHTLLKYKNDVISFLNFQL